MHLLGRQVKEQFSGAGQVKEQMACHTRKCTPRPIPPAPPESTTWPRTMRARSGTIPENGARNGGRLLPASCGRAGGQAQAACDEKGATADREGSRRFATVHGRCGLPAAVCVQQVRRKNMPQSTTHLRTEGDGQRQLTEQLLRLSCAPHFYWRQAVLANRRLQEHQTIESMAGSIGR